jgi:hypothetical protein
MVLTIHHTVLSEWKKHSQGFGNVNQCPVPNLTLGGTQQEKHKQHRRSLENGTDTGITVLTEGKRNLSKVANVIKSLSKQNDD